MLNDPTVIILMYFILPLWLAAGFADWRRSHPGQNMKDPLRDTKVREGGLQRLDERDQAALMAEISNSSVILSLTSTPPASSAAL